MSLMLKPYPEYKRSGVTSLGDIPLHWDVLRLKALCRMAYGDSLPTGTRNEGSVPVFGSNGRIGSHSFSNTQAPCIVIGRKGSFGKVNFSSVPVYAIDTTFFVDGRFTAVDLRWLYYLLCCLRLDEISKDSAVPGLDREDAYQRVAALPSVSEQTAIASFLSHFDRSIDRVIRSKRRLIELLNEQKQVIINQAVTRGLDPNVRLKPSGIEWLGEVPEHWRHSRLKFETTHIVDCIHATPVYIPDGEYPAVRTADVEPGNLRLETAKRVSREQYEIWTTRLVPKHDDILYTREGERYGLAALVPNGPDLCISQRMMVFRIRSTHHSAFIMWQLNCPHVYAQAAADVIGATAPHINVERIKNYRIMLPPQCEQIEIEQYVSERCGSIEQATANARRQIQLLREYRTRLVSDVVTGKLDVCGVELPALDETESEDLEALEETEAEELDNVEEEVDE